MPTQKNNTTVSNWVFPKWANKAPLFLLGGLSVLFCGIVFVFWYWFTDKNFSVGYIPEQPIPYSHKLHAGELGIDCRYCHYTVDVSASAGVPPTEVCMNCHSVIKKDSPVIKKVKECFESNTPIEWVRVHQLPDYAYFNHSQHINSGVSCVTCHGRVDQMEVIHQVESLSMSWCLECHRNPEKFIRPKEKVTQLWWEPEGAVQKQSLKLLETQLSPQEKMGLELIETYNIHPREDCTACHR